MLSNIVSTLITVVIGIGAAVLLYWVLNKLVSFLPRRAQTTVLPYVFILPALLAIIAYLVYPTILTVINSFKDSISEEWVGWDNYSNLINQNPYFWESVTNTLLWVLLVPAVAIILGLLVAVLVDRLNPRAEKTAKTLIFMPMAISAVAAATAWRFIYSVQIPPHEQLGLLNGIWTMFGAEPVPWLTISDARFNSILLMVMMLWAQVGFAMVLLSAAVKGVPTETLEAARIDGANEVQIFRRVVIPQIWPTIVTVFITVTITVMKIFDTVYVMTGGSFKTDVIGLMFFQEMFTNFNNGSASAIVVVLMLAIIPIMIFQVRQFRREEAAR